MSTFNPEDVSRPVKPKFSETRFNSYKDWECAVDRLSQVICVLDKDLHVLRVNRVIESWGLQDVRKANGLKLHQLLHSGCQQKDCSLMTWLNWASSQLNAQEKISGDLWDEGLGRYLNIRLLNISREQGSCEANPERAVLCTIEDIGDYKRAETEQYNLSVKLIEALEQERKRISLDLHDGISQTLSAIKFNLEAEITKIPRQEAEEIQSGLKGVVQKMRSALEDLRRISMDLWPSMLDDLGIISTVQWLVREYQIQQEDIQWELINTIKEEDIREDLKITIFRVLQESLSNAMKYSKADHVVIRLFQTNKNICLVIEDNGQGFDLDKAKEHNGIGLRSIQERADLTRGKLQIASSKNGTKISVEW